MAGAIRKDTGLRDKSARNSNRVRESLDAIIGNSQETLEITECLKKIAEEACRLSAKDVGMNFFSNRTRNLLTELDMINEQTKLIAEELITADGRQKVVPIGSRSERLQMEL